MRISGLMVSGLALSWCAVATVAAAQKPAQKPKARPVVRPAAVKPQPAAKAPAPKPDPRNPSTEKVSPEAAEYFEKHVRPVLAEQCYNCHGAKIQQAGLRVDTLAGLLKGADTGKPALVPGNPDASPLIQVIRYAGAVKMPPQGKLSPEAITALENWVKMGAPWPQSGAAVTPDSQGGHWAFQPVRKPAVPAVKTKAWVKNPVDAFVLRKLEQKGLQPSRPADRRTLIRRAYFDLLGLPPTAEEVDAFVNDPSPNAWEKLIDRLLASPHYGERWGRYWLDVARYADTKGYVFQEERRYPFSYTYRDWVIEAFNKDMPYDQFLTYQLAADHVVQGDDKKPLAAMGYLTLGRRFLNNVHDIIDDRLDVVFRGTQALTVSCARCHDHKFDPIPIKDYYSLYGVFASSMEPAELPLIAEPVRNAEYLEYEKKLRALEGELRKFLESQNGVVVKRAREKLAVSLLAARDATKPGANAGNVARAVDLPPALVQRWVNFLKSTRADHHPIFTPWNTLAALPDAEFAAKAPALMAEYAANKDQQKKLHPAIAGIFAAPLPQSLKEVAERYALVLNAPTDDQQLQNALTSIGGPLNISVDETRQFFNRDDRNKLNALQQKIDKFKATAPGAPPRAMVLVDAPQPVTPRVFLRGNPNNRGEEVPRQFLAVLSGPERQPFQKGSGRLELAQKIASKDNPLTARVMVNRVWLWHFGNGLVSTPSDFGIRSEPPSHPELLDWLATYFMENGWSIKKLHRLIMLSNTYQQSSDLKPKYEAADPENRLLWRMNRRRLDLEALRDSLLRAAGTLNAEVGGPAVDITQAPFSTRRTVYGFIDRQNLPGLFRTFDFASPDAHSPQRYLTTVPQQALFLMNSPFVVEQAKALAQRAEVVSKTEPAARVQQLYRLILSRNPTADETRAGVLFVQTAGDARTGTVTPAADGKASPRLSPWEQYIQVLLMSNEFAFID